MFPLQTIREHLFNSVWYICLQFAYKLCSSVLFLLLISGCFFFIDTWIHLGSLSYSNISIYIYIQYSSEEKNVQYMILSRILINPSLTLCFVMDTVERKLYYTTPTHLLLRVCSNRAFLTKIKVCPISAVLKLLQYVIGRNSLVLKKNQVK